jgi:hypothetical protein
LSLGYSIEDLALYSDGVFQPIQIPGATRSDPFNYVGSPVLQFYAQSDLEVLPPEQREPPFVTPILTLALNPEAEQPLLVFDRNRGAGARVPYRSFVLEESAQAFPPNSYRFFNVTGSPLMGELNGKRFALGTRQSVTVSPMDGERNTSNMVIKLALARDEQWDLIYSSKWSFQPDRRTLVFLLPSARSPQSVTVRRIGERLPPAVE